MRTYRYLLSISGEAAKGYTATVPSLTGISAYGQTVEESIIRAKDAIRQYITDLVGEGEPAPRDDEGVLITWATVDA